jgi:ribosomal protein L22
MTDRMSPPPEGGWESLKVDELRAELEARGLPKSGKKDELVARLADDDLAQKENVRAETPAEDAAPDEGGVAEEVAVSKATGQPVAEEILPPAEPAEEPSADEVEAEAEAAERPARRRGSAETSTGTRRAAPRRPDGDLVVRARSKYVRSAPRKARLVMDHIRGKEVEQARAILGHAPRAVADDILRLLNSAVANAESAYELGPDELRVLKAFVDEGPTIKRYRPRALGRATKINKRTSHMTIELTTTGNAR